jgi:predicted ArsR family transcriptional regulator
MPESQSERLARVAALGDPLRRALYLHVSSQQESVSREQIADRFGVSRAVAAFHLDKLADLGLLEVEFKRPPGRTGPGAGRPAKRYRAGEREISVSLPPREYELAGCLLAEAVTTSTRDGVPVDEALSDAARRVGRSLGRRAREATAEQSTEGLARAACAVLNSCGYDPREEGDEWVLTNCPFHALAADYRELVCGMNLALIRGLTEEVGASGLDARLDPHPGRCCVRLTRRSS